MTDRTVLEAASWRLASELVRRHPHATRLIRAHPGGGQSDCLWFLNRAEDGPGDIRLNRNGTIRVLHRFDGRPVDESADSTWEEYLAADPVRFLLGLEAAAGLPVPTPLPALTPVAFTCRVLATIAATAIKTIHPVDIQPGLLDTSSHGGGPNPHLGAFSGIPPELLQPRKDDLLGEPGYRFWILLRTGKPVLAFEQRQGLAWTRREPTTIPLRTLYEQFRGDVVVTSLALLART